MLECKYKVFYEALEDRKTQKEFECKEEALPSGYCVFHDEHYIEDENNTLIHANIVRSRLIERIHKDMREKGELRYVGYHLPTIQITEEFTKHVSFFRSTFKNAADFSEAKFLAGVDFSECKFYGKVDFYGAKFADLATFIGTKFLDYSDFRYVEISGLADFSYAQFAEILDFSDVHCKRGPIFVGIKFKEGVNFARASLREAHFDGSDITGGEFTNADLSDSRFRRTNLRTANLYGARLSRSNLRGANLEYANLDGTDLREADFTYAKNLPISPAKAIKRGAIVSSISVYHELTKEESFYWFDIERKLTRDEVRQIEGRAKFMIITCAILTAVIHVVMASSDLRYQFSYILTQMSFIASIVCFILSYQSKKIQISSNSAAIRSNYFYSIKWKSRLQIFGFGLFVLGLLIAVTINNLENISVQTMTTMSNIPSDSVSYSYLIGNWTFSGTTEGFEVSGEISLNADKTYENIILDIQSNGNYTLDEEQNILRLISNDGQTSYKLRDIKVNSFVAYNDTTSESYIYERSR